MKNVQQFLAMCVPGRLCVMRSLAALSGSFQDKELRRVVKVDGNGITFQPYIAFDMHQPEGCEAYLPYRAAMLRNASVDYPEPGRAVIVDTTGCPAIEYDFREQALEKVKNKPQ